MTMSFDITRAEHRVKQMSEGEMLTWLESAIPGMQRHLEAYVRSRNPDHLGEFVIAETTAHIVTQELMERKFKPVVKDVELPPAPSASTEQEKDTDTTSARKRFLKGRRGKTGTARAPKPGTE